MSPETSVIIPAYNAGETIKSALMSCLRQTNVDQTYEIIVVNDGSRDKTGEVLWMLRKKLPRNSFRIIEQDNQGSASAINLGVTQSCGEKIILCDADDLLCPLAVNLLSQALKGHAWATGEHIGFKRDSAERTEVIYTTHKQAYLGDDKSEDNPLLHVHALGHPKSFWKTDFEKVEGMDANLRIAHDYDLALKLLFSGEVKRWGLVPVVLYWYQSRPTSISHVYREQQIKEGELTVTCALRRLRISKRGECVGRDQTGYLLFNHVALGK